MPPRLNPAISFMLLSCLSNRIGWKFWVSNQVFNVAQRKFTLQILYRSCHLAYVLVNSLLCMLQVGKYPFKCFVLISLQLSKSAPTHLLLCSAASPEASWCSRLAAEASASGSLSGARVPAWGKNIWTDYNWSTDRPSNLPWNWT